MAEAVPCILGVDPGLSGALAFYFPTHDRVSVHDMPVVAGKVDGYGLSEAIRQLRPTHAVIEQVATRPGQGISSAFNFGEGCGVVRGVVASLAVPVVFVTPTSWKRHFRLSQDKDESRKRAMDLFPSIAKDFSRKKDDGRAEAALIARWFADTSPLMRKAGEAA